MGELIRFPVERARHAEDPDELLRATLPPEMGGWPQTICPSCGCGVQLPPGVEVPFCPLCRASLDRVQTSLFDARIL